MLVTRLACLAVLSAALACGGGGGDDGGTTNPPPPPPNDQTLGSISTSLSSISLDAGETETITVSAFDTQGRVIPNPGAPVFTSSSATVAEVDASGTVLGISQGSATINVSLTRDGITRTASVATTVSGTLPLAADVSTQAGDYFTPNSVIVSQGGQVTWTFGAVEHTVVFTAVPGAPTAISSGGYSSSQSRTFQQRGNFLYTCTIHAGMSGQVLVR